MDLSGLPLEIQLIILSKLPAEILWDLNLSDKFYWLIYKEFKSSVKWDPQIDWKFKLFPPHTFRTEGELYVYSVSDLIHETCLYFNTREKTFFHPVSFGKKSYFVKTLNKNIIWKNWYTVYHSKSDEFLTGTYRQRTIKKHLDRVEKILNEVASVPFPWILKTLEYGIIRKYNRIVHRGLPLLFFSSDELRINDFKMTDPSVDREIARWNLIDGAGVRKGIAVLQPEFYTMFGDAIGLAEYKNSDQKTQALGQFNPCHVNVQPRYVSHRCIPETDDEFLSEDESSVDFWSSDSSSYSWCFEEDSQDDSDF